MMLYSMLAVFQQFAFRGQIVVDSSYGVRKTPCPVAGVSVYAVGTSISSTSNADGFFELVLPTGQYAIVANHSSHKLVINAKVRYEMADYAYYYYCIINEYKPTNVACCLLLFPCARMGTWLLQCPVYQSVFVLVEMIDI